MTGPGSRGSRGTRGSGRNAGRSTTGEAAVPYYVESPASEAARHLRTTATRFLAQRATRGDLDEAARIWLGPAPPSDQARALIERAVALAREDRQIALLEILVQLRREVGS